MVGGALELERADEAPARARREPALDQPEEPCRITDHVREQPVDRTDRARVQAEGALSTHFHARHGRDRGIERCLVDADDAGTQFRQNPGPAAGAAAEVEAALAHLWVGAEERQRLPELEVGAAWR